MAMYICPVCKGKSEYPKVCETPLCSRQGQTLISADLEQKDLPKKHAEMDQNPEKENK